MTTSGSHSGQALQDYGYHGLPEQLNRQNSACMGVNQHIGLTQTCGYPLKHQLGNQVELMGTPIYRATFCRDGYYASVVLVRQEDSRTSLQEFRGATPAVNSLNSQSGYNALRNLVHMRSHRSSQPFFSMPYISGAHRQSICAVAQRRADICAIDPVSWQLARRYEPAARQLRLIDLTEYTPALPLVCSTGVAHAFRGKLGSGPDALRQTVKQAWLDSIDHDPATAQTLLVNGIVSIDRSSYCAVPTLTVAL